MAPVYKIKEFILKDENDNVVMIRNMYIVVTNRDFSFQVILSFSSLRKMNYQYLSYSNEDGIQKELNPQLIIYPQREIYYMNAQFTEVTKEVLDILKREYPNIDNYIEQPRIINNVYTFIQK